MCKVTNYIIYVHIYTVSRFNIIYSKIYAKFSKVRERWIYINLLIYIIFKNIY